jgi:HEAT repeat protein
VKTSTIVALGKLGDVSAIPQLEKFADDPNLSIREEAIYAINALSGNKRKDLIHDKLFQSKRSEVRRRAAIALGKAGDHRAREFLLACLEWGGCHLSEVEPFLRADKNPATPGRLLLAWTRGREDLTDLVADLRPSGTASLALSTVDASIARGDDDQAKVAIDLVGDLADASGRSRLERHTASTDTWLRLHAAVALARLGDPNAAQGLLREMDNLAADWLPGFAKLLSRIEEAPVRAALTPRLVEREKSNDVDMAMAAAAIRLAWDPDTAVFRMLDGLSSSQGEERALAETYLAKDRSQRVTWLLRRALARENRPHTRDVLRKILDMRPGS